MKSNQWYTLLSLFLITMLIQPDLKAQYFGSNKPRYDKLDFSVAKTPHFDIYHVMEDRGRLYSFAGWAEQWAHQHSTLLHNELPAHNPIILYNDHGQFQQTNTVQGNISVGTGGVTEAFKNRVVLPWTFSNEQTHHVLGHELVHAFQYNMIINGDSTNIRNLQNLPLWMVEGMAEYLSRGSKDAFTAMWMRDAVLNDDVPDLKKLSDGRYFPYRYGQAFWAFISARYGDQAIAPLFTNTAKYGLDVALKGMFAKTEKEMGDEFVRYLKDYYKPYLLGKKEDRVGKPIITDKNAGRMNVSPVVSPDGRYVVFLSEKDLFSTSLFVAKTSDGSIIRRLASNNSGGHIEEFNYLESTGSWSPDSKQFAFIIFNKGRNELLIKNVETGKTIRSEVFDEVRALANPAWSPDGKTIVLSGMKDGQTDLYAFDLKTGKLTQLTDDAYSELQPAWSPDGRSIVYATDQLTYNNGRRLNKWTFNIAVRDMASGEARIPDLFTGANNLNPQVDNQGNIYFLSDRDGYRNIYKYVVDADSLFQMSRFITGVTGITEYSPALSVSPRRDRMVYSYYNDHEYTIYTARPEAMELIPVDRHEIEQSAGMLPHNTDVSKSIVDNAIDQLDRIYTDGGFTISEEAYKPRIRLDMITGGTGIGVGNNRGYGNSTNLNGGIFALFSDMLGDQQIYTNLALSGQIYDFGGQVFYLNNKNRIGWGLGISHYPAYYSALSNIQQDQLQNQGSGEVIPVQRYDIDLIRRFEEGISGIVQLPFNVTHRVELGGGYSRYHYRYTRLSEYYYFDPANPYHPYTGRLVYADENKIDAPAGFDLFNVSTALVGDNAQWGVASPLNGFRYRLGVERYFGRYDFTASVLDARYYKFLKPVSLSARLYNYNRYGLTSQNSDIYPLFAIDPTIVRGFLRYSEQEFSQLLGIPYRSTYGNKLLAGSFEVRLPFTGPEQLSLFRSKFLFTELALFFDSGVAFESFSDFSNDVESFRPPVLMSGGVSARINLFGSVILEPYYARTLNKGGRWNFGLNLVPGW